MKNQRILLWSAALAIGWFAVACNNDATVAPKPGMTPGKPVFGTVVESNGPGACMGDDAFAANGLVSNWVSGVGSATDVNCTSNDISVANSTISRYSKISASGPFTNLSPTDTISCSPGDTIYAEVIANLHSTATERYNIGVWIANPPGSGSGVTGSCTQYNLIPGTHGSTEINSPLDKCGDMTSAADTVKVDLDILTLTCPSGQTHVTINNCIGWQNSDQTSARGSCPNTTMGTTTVDSAHAFRYGTLPETKAKCNCTPFSVPIEVRGKITIVKKTVGGDGAFQFTSDVGSNSDPVVTSPFTITTVSDSGSQLFSSVKAGTYHIAESVLAPNFDFTSLSCHANNAFASATISSQTATITILNGGGDIVCTFTNTKRTFLTLVKTVTNDQGGTKTVSDFPLTASGPVTISGVSGTTDVTARQVSAGTYALTETTQAGYGASTWSCTGGTQSGSSVTLATGNNATCSINNNDIGATLTLVKALTNNNGGTKTLSDFALTASGPVTISGVSGTTSVTAAPVHAGTYALSEQTQAGYTSSTWSCTGGTQSGANITLNLGGAATCTISNDDIGPTLTLVKTVTNDNGGTKTVSDFALTASGPIPPSCSAGSTSGVTGNANVTNKVLCAGTYALSEQTQAGYTPSTWSCTGGTQSGANITLALAGSATCTINNNDNPPELTLVKVVTNNNGGTKTLSDFPLTASGPVTISGVSGTTQVTARPVTAGTYALTEQTQAGYTASTWSCSGGTQSGTNITLGLGESSTCTISNNDIGPMLTLVKTVTNDNGGTKTVSDFALTATGPIPPSCSAGSTSGVTGNANVTNKVLCAGTYALSEQTQAGYTPSTWSCTGGTQSGANITLALAGNATCTINNNDIAPKLIIKKTVIGAGATFGFTATSNGSFITSPFTLSPPSNSSDSVVYTTTAMAGTFSVTEGTMAGYTLTDLGCSDQPVGTYNPTSTRTVIDTLSLGETVTCTFINQQIVSPTTRTQGFWATHDSLTNAVWFGGTVGGNTFPGVSDQTLCGRSLNTLPIVLGGFWSNIAMTTTKDKRSSLDQRRMQLLQQLLAAILNNAAFGSSPSGSISIADAKAAYCGTDETAIQNALNAMASFNSGGDTGAFTPGISANGKRSKDEANLSFWDTLP